MLPLPGALELVKTELPEREYAERLAELAAQIRRDYTPILQLVEALGPFLTGEDDAQRARATSVLAEVVEAVQAAAAGEGEVHHLAEFFTSRLTDWPAVRGALHGCLALLSRRSPEAARRPAPAEPQPQPQLSSPDDAAAVALVRTCVSHVFIRALTQPDRALALRLVAAAMRGYGQALVEAGIDLLEYLISSVDGEKDPRCLLLSFDAVQELLSLYHRQPDTSLCHERLEEGAEELFEVLACYFPVTFTPPPNDPNRISRADIAAGLEATLAAEPLFAPYLVPLAMEKLSSTLRQAKLDSLSLVGACAASWGLEPLESHVSTLWAALRAELAAPASEGLLPADLAAAEELAAAAATCLTRCVGAFQRSGGGTRGAPAGASLAHAVLGDPIVRDMLACVAAPGADPAVHRRSAVRAKAGARAVGALCRAGGSAAGRAAAQLLPPLLAAAAAGQDAGAVGAGAEAGPASWQSQCLAWAAVIDLLESTAAALPESMAAAAAAVDPALLQQVVAAAAAGLAAAAAAAEATSFGEQGEPMSEEEWTGGGSGGSSGGCDGADGSTQQRQQHARRERWALHPTDCTQQRAGALQLAALAAVFANPCLAASLEGAQVEAAAASIVQLLLAAPSGSSTADSTSTTASTQNAASAAVAPLTALAGSRHAGVLASSALPLLVAAVGQRRLAAAALAALRALAAASSGLQLEIVVALDQAIQQQLPAAAAAAAAAAAGSGAGAGTSLDSDSGAAPLLLQLLQAATAIVSAPPPTAAAAAAAATEVAAAAASCVRLGQHLLDAALLLPPPEAAAVGPALQAACAELAFCAQRAAPAAQQAPLAAASASALLEGQAAAGGGLQLSVCSALLVPLRQEAVATLPGEQAAALVQHCVQAALAQPVEGPAARWAGAAAASLLNKWAADAGALSACLSKVVQGQLYPACGLTGGSDGSSGSGSGGLPAPDPVAWSCLAAVCRGVGMRGLREADAAVGGVLGCLDAAAQQWQQQAGAGLGPAAAAPGAGVPAGDSLAAGASMAARFLGALLDSSGSIGGGSGGSGSSAGVGLNKQSHAVSKPLWQQRLYTLATSQLLGMLQRSMQAAATAAAGDGGGGWVALPAPPPAARTPPSAAAAAAAAEAGEEVRPLASPVLLLALAHLLQSVPAAVLQQEVEQRRMLPWLAQCLVSLQHGPLADGDLLQALLLLLSSALMSDAGRKQAESELLPRLVPALLALAAYRPRPAVRETALQCLLLLVELPYTALHPYRRQVARLLAAAVDDNRRAVRLQAVRCRQAWSAA